MEDMCNDGDRDGGVLLLWGTAVVKYKGVD